MKAKENKSNDFQVPEAPGSAHDFDLRKIPEARKSYDSSELLGLAKLAPTVKEGEHRAHVTNS